jgi:hypothetical protein
MLRYTVKRLSNGWWAVKLGATTLSRWPSHRRQEAIDSAVERAKEFWARAPVGFKTIVVRAPDADGAAVTIWTAGEAPPDQPET